MTLKTIPFGVIGLSLALAGMIGYHFSPEHIGIVTAIEGAALICLILFFILHADTVKAVASRRSTRMGANSLFMVLLFHRHPLHFEFSCGTGHSLRWDLSENQNFWLARRPTGQSNSAASRSENHRLHAREKDSYQTYKERLDPYRQASAKIAVGVRGPGAATESRAEL